MHEAHALDLNWGHIMQKHTSEITKNNAPPVFNFDLDRMTAAVNSDTISFPRKGMSHQERKEWIRAKLSQLDGK